MLGNARTRLLITSYASFTLALLSMIHALYIIMITSEKDVPGGHVLDEFLFQMRATTCRYPVLRMLALISGFTAYLLLYSVISLGISVLIASRSKSLPLLLTLILVLGIISPALSGMFNQGLPTLYHPVYTLPTILMEAGFRGILYCKGLSLEELRTSDFVRFSLPVLAQILLAITMYLIYKRLRWRSLLIPLITSTIPPILLLFPIMLLLQDSAPEWIPFLIRLIGMMVLIHILVLAPVYGIILWGVLGVLLLRYAKKLQGSVGVQPTA